MIETKIKERKKIDVKLYKKYFLTSHLHYYLWEGDSSELDIKDEDKDKYLYIKALKGTEFAYVYTIKDGEVNYHGIVYWFIIDLLTVEELQEHEYKSMLERIPDAFADNMRDAFANRRNVL